jgi:hypothetical protein
LLCFYFSSRWVYDKIITNVRVKSSLFHQLVNLDSSTICLKWIFKENLVRAGNNKFVNCIKISIFLIIRSYL